LQGSPAASTAAALLQVFKEHPPRAVVRSIDRWPVPMRRPVEPEKKKARILSESGPLRTELGGTRYALPSPGCTWSSARSSQQRLVEAKEPGVPMCMPSRTEPTPAAARTNAPRPCSGRCVLMT
jgi:hypothetical protein